MHIREEGAGDLALELTNISLPTKRERLVRLDASLPPSSPILSSCVTATVAEQATWVRHPARLVGIGAFPTLIAGSLIEYVAGHHTDSASRASAERFAEQLGKAAVFVEDSVGVVMPRILCMIVNEAYFALLEQVAKPDAIDTAMKLGTNYPRGPLEWAHAIGLKHVVAVMEALQRYYGEDRYRCAPLLWKAAQQSGKAG